jgi:hypothetical protein
MKSKQKLKKTSDKHTAYTWTEYVIAHLVKAQLRPDESIIVMVPNQQVKQFIDKAISELCEQTYSAWQLQTKITTVH